MKHYVQTDLEADREVASTLADLIVGGLLATIQVKGPALLFKNRVVLGLLHLSRLNVSR